MTIYPRVVEARACAKSNSASGNQHSLDPGSIPMTRILVADDDQDVRAALRVALKPFTPGELLDKLRNRAPRI